MGGLFRPKDDDGIGIALNSDAAKESTGVRGLAVKECGSYGISDGLVSFGVSDGLDSFGKPDGLDSFGEPDGLISLGGPNWIESLGEPDRLVFLGEANGFEIILPEE